MSTDDPRKLQWIRLNDFSPGIADRDFNTGGLLGPWPLGTATVDDTWGCRALPNGALGPLPLRQRGFTHPFPSPILAGTAVNVLGFLIQGDVREAPTTGYDEANWIIATDYKFQSGANVQRRFKLERRREWKQGGPADSLENVVDTLTDAGTHRMCFMESNRAQPTDPTIPGVPGVAYSWYAVGGVAGIWSQWPNPSTPTSLTPASISTLYNGAPMVVYQGRSLICDHANYANGPVNVQWRSNENIYFTKSNLLSLFSTVASTFTPEDPGEIMAMAVSAQNELLVLKHRQGAFVIRGDISFPTVLRVPGLMGTGRLPSIPAVTPVGVMYPSKNNGIYLWPGGEESFCVSEQIEPERFLYNLLSGDQNGNWAYDNCGGRLHYYQDLVFVPPRFVYNYKHQSWWQLEDPDDTDAPRGYLWFQTSISRTSIIAVRAEYYAGEFFAFAYDFRFAKYNYHWKSQPIAETMNSDVKVREVVLRATGLSGSTVTINLYAFGAVETHVFSLDGVNYPRELRKLSALDGGDIQIEIIADGGVDLLGESQAAPTVYEVRLGWYETNTLPVETAGV